MLHELQPLRGVQRPVNSGKDLVCNQNIGNFLSMKDTVDTNSAKHTKY